MVKEMIFIALAISLVITAIYACTWPGMIFHNPTSGIKNLLDAKKVGVIYKPLFGCLICMSSFWTFFAWLISGGRFHLVAVMFCVTGINTVITALIKDIIPDE